MLHFFFEKGRPRMLELWREFDLMPPQQMIIGLLDEPRPMGELAHHLHCDNSNITGIVDRLTERGLVERRAADGDRRVKLVALTEAGRELRDELARRRAIPPPELERAAAGRPRAPAQDLLDDPPSSLRLDGGSRRPDLVPDAREGHRRLHAQTARSWGPSPRCRPTTGATSSTASSSIRNSILPGGREEIPADEIEEIYERGVVLSAGADTAG